MVERPREWFKSPAPSVPTLKINFKGLFDMKELYKLIHEWLKDADWTDIEETDDFAHEVLYHERIGISGLKDLWIWWKMKKASGNKYYSYSMDINFLIIAMGTSEVIYNGQKVKAHDAEVVIEISPKIVLDQGIFEKSLRRLSCPHVHYNKRYTEWRSFQTCQHK